MAGRDALVCAQCGEAEAGEADETPRAWVTIYRGEEELRFCCWECAAGWVQERRPERPKTREEQLQQMIERVAAAAWDRWGP